MTLLLLRAVEFAFYHHLLTIVDRISRLPRNTTMPEAARLYRENIALKAQLDAYENDVRRTRLETIVENRGLCRARHKPRFRAIDSTAAFHFESPIQNNADRGSS